MALTANFQAHGGNAYHDLGRYEHRDEERAHGKHRGGGGSYRRHDDYKPYKDQHDRRDGGGGGHRDHRDRGGRDWTNGHPGNSSNRRRF